MRKLKQHRNQVANDDVEAIKGRESPPNLERLIRQANQSKQFWRINR
jgi:hypothetical protein